MRYTASAIALVLVVLVGRATDNGWIALPAIVMQALLACLALAFVPLYLAGLREGELVMPPRTIRRRDMPPLFWCVAVLEGLVAPFMVGYLGGEFVQGWRPERRPPPAIPRTAIP